MKIFSIVILLLLLFPFKSIYPQKELIIDTDDMFICLSVRMDNNGDFVATCIRDSADYNFKGGVVKFNDALQYEYYEPQNDTAYFEFKDLIVTDDNNYLIAATIGKNIGLWKHNHTIYLVLLNENLELIAENFYELPEENDNPYLRLMQNTDGRIYLTIDEPSNFLKGTLEVSPNAEILKDKMYFGMGHPTLNPFPKSDGGLYLLRGNPVPWAFCGITEVDTCLNYGTTYLFPMEVNGIMYDMGTRGSCKWLNDTTYLLCSEGSLETETVDLHIYKINNHHEFLMEPLMIGHEYYDDIVPNYQSISWTDPQRIYVVGSMQPSMNFKSTYYVAIINEDLELLGYKICGGDKNTWISGIIATPDGGCVMVGSQRDYHAGNPLDGEGYIARFHPDEIITSAAETTNPYDSDYMLFPNPGSDQLNIQTARKGVKIEMFDQTGRMVVQQKLNDEFRNHISIDNLPAGLHHCRLTDKQGYVENKKWIKQ
jgi:hypothetical protein